MDGHARTEQPPALPSALHGYDRRAVEDFFEKAATRRTRLVNVIAEANARRERAVDAQSRNRAIAHDARRELDEIRAEAESRATQIIVAARLEAQLVLREAHEQAGIANDADTVLDLRDGNDGRDAHDGSNRSHNGTSPQGGSLSFATLAATSRATGTYDEAAASDYFEYLRGTLPGGHTRGGADVTTTDTFSSPDPVEIIPADQIRPLIGATERELAVLERTATESIAAANDAEEWERSATNDGDASAWSLIRVHREQRDEAQRDADVMIELATKHAQYLIQEARAEADEILARAVPTDARPTEARPIAERPTDHGGSRPGGTAVVDAPVVTPPVATAPIVTPPVAPRIAEPPSAPQASATNGARATAVLDAPTVQTPVVIPPAPVPPISEPVVVAPVVVPPVVQAPVVPEPVVVAPPVVPQPTVAPPQPPVANDAFWAADESAKRRFKLPFSAVLEATAVLLILVFILLRLS